MHFDFIVFVDSTESELAVGGLWRDVLNELGDAQVTAYGFLPLLQTIGPKWAGWTHFLGCMARDVDKAAPSPAVARDVIRTNLGFRLWVERRPELRRWADRGEHGPLTDEQFEDLWFGDSLRGIVDRERCEDFLANVIGPSLPGRGAFVADLKEFKHGVIVWLRWNLKYVKHLEMLRRIAVKTWPASLEDRGHWTRDEFNWVNSWFTEQEPSLMEGDPDADLIDPAELEIFYSDQSIGFGLDGLGYCLYVLMRSTVADFVEELLDSNRYPQRRGSLRCIECGLFVGRRAIGYGQLYCSPRCKKRVAKRRYRAKRRKAGAVA